MIGKHGRTLSARPGANARRTATPQKRLAGALAAGLLIGATVVPTARAGIVLGTQYPVAGSACNVMVQDETNTPRSGATITVTYRPGSSVEKKTTVGTTNTAGRIEWTPELAGIATVEATWDDASASTNVSVRFARAPIGGLLIMILAGLVLVGGSAVRIRRVLRGDETES